MTDYPEGEYSDEEEWQDNYQEEQREAWEEGQNESTGGNYPVAKKPDTLFSLFKDVWRTIDSSKVSNLDKDEIGSLNISVRDCQRIALLSTLLKHKKFAGYFDQQGEIILSTAMSKKGWFVELFVTSKKFAHKGNLGNLVQQNQKWRIFGKDQQQTNEGNQQ